MGRLVKPLTKERWDALPPWRRWLNRHAVWVVPLALAVAAVLATLLAEW